MINDERFYYLRQLDRAICYLESCVGFVSLEKAVVFQRSFDFNNEMLDYIFDMILYCRINGDYDFNSDYLNTWYYLHHNFTLSNLIEELNFLENKQLY